MTVDDVRQMLRGQYAPRAVPTPEADIPPDAVSATVETVQTVEKPQADAQDTEDKARRKSTGRKTQDS